MLFDCNLFLATLRFLCCLTGR